MDGQENRAEDIKVLTGSSETFYKAPYFTGDSPGDVFGFSEQVRAERINIQDTIFFGQFLHDVCGATGVHCPPVSRCETDYILII